jgi:hypothetical protein
MRLFPALALAVAGLSSPLAAESPLTRLADAAAAEIVRLAQGKPIELVSPEDRTGRSGMGRDLRDLILHRIEGRATLSDTGTRLRIAPVLAEAPGRLLFTARVTEEPGGRLRDVLSFSAPVDAALLSLVPLSPTVSVAGLDVVASSRTPPLESPILALAFLGEHDLIVLLSESVALYRLDANGLSLITRASLSGRRESVRSPGGIVLPAGTDSFWALSSAKEGARLFAVERSKLVIRGQADALPWPGSPRGVRFRPGTNLIEASLQGLGEGAFLALDTPDGGLAVSPEGKLTWAGETVESPRVGPTVAALWPGVIAASSTAPPGEADALLLLKREASGPRLFGRLPMDGSVRALASRRRDEGARLVAAVEEAPGATHLLVMDLAPGGP